MNNITSSPGVPAQAQQQLPESFKSFSIKLQQRESDLLRVAQKGAGEEPFQEFRAFIDTFLRDDILTDLKEAALVGNSLHLLLQEPQVRQIAIECIPYLDTSLFSKAQVTIIEALGAFVRSDDAVRIFFESICEKTVGGLLSVNEQASCQALCKLSEEDIEGKKTTLSRAEIFRIFGLES